MHFGDFRRASTCRIENLLPVTRCLYSQKNHPNIQRQCLSWKCIPGRMCRNEECFVVFSCKTENTIRRIKCYIKFVCCDIVHSTHFILPYLDDGFIWWYYMVVLYDGIMRYPQNRQSTKHASRPRESCHFTKPCCHFLSTLQWIAWLWGVNQFGGWDSNIQK